MTRGRMLGARMRLDPAKLRQHGFVLALVDGVPMWRRIDEPEPRETDNHDPGDEDRT